MQGQGTTKIRLLFNGNKVASALVIPKRGRSEGGGEEGLGVRRDGGHGSPQNFVRRLTEMCMFSPGLQNRSRGHTGSWASANHVVP